MNLRDINGLPKRFCLYTKIKEIENGISDDNVTKMVAVKYSMELEKKMDVFKGHLTELEVAVENDESEQERFIEDYDSYEEVLDCADNILTKLKFIEKYEEHEKLEEGRKLDQKREAEVLSEEKVNATQTLTMHRDVCH